MHAIPGLSVVVPLLNEEKNVEPLVQEIHTNVGPRARVYEIILVNDGSQDRTGAMCDALSRRDARVRVVHHEKNRGYGAALRSGFHASCQPYIFTTDGDLQFDMAEIGRLLQLLEGADIVMGYRAHRMDPAHRRVNATVYKQVMRRLFGVTQKDLDCAFKIYRRDSLEALTLVSDGILISGEILMRAMRQGFVIREVAVSHYPRTHGRQTGNHPRVVATAMVELARLWRASRQQESVARQTTAAGSGGGAGS
ncbi:MAG: glycosyltransferase family 2 protein [Candidatus Polarisedimenticolia bacterium]